MRLFRHFITLSLSISAFAQTGAGWPAYGGDPSGSRFSSSTQITRDNISHLHPAWTFHTHALDRDRPGARPASFEATPILSGDTLYFTSPFDVVFAIDAHTGTSRWSFDPRIHGLTNDTLVTSRGVALWESSQPITTCSRRIFLGTLDARLVALDATTGDICKGFGHDGSIDLRQNVHFQTDDDYGITSPPTIIGNTVVMGSGIGDNQRVDAESGVVRGFDVITGAELWAWEPLEWAQSQSPRTGAGNTWSIISADPVLDLIFLPTGSPSPDYYGGKRLGDNRDADSIVALDARTGKKVWSFQLVHHDLWDYDVPAEPVLFTFHGGIPAIAVVTKMGMVFVFDRRNGTPLYSITEKPVPPSDVPGEQTSPTQPFSSLPSLSPLSINQPNATAFDRSFINRLVCRVKFSQLRYEGIFTPPSTSGTVLFPGNLGGVNWGGAALDPTTGVLYANTNRVAYSAKLVPRNGVYMFWHIWLEPDLRDWPVWIYIAAGILILNIIWRIEHNRKRFTTHIRQWVPSPRAAISAMLVAFMAAIVCIFPRPLNLSHFGHELSPQNGTPYFILRDPINDWSSHPCVPPPWGAITALNLNTGTTIWQQPLGGIAPNQPTGLLNFGGPIITAAGIVFTAAAEDTLFRAFDAASGKQIWQSELPAPAQSTPMTYTLDGHQYIVIAAGGHADRSAHRGDSLVAFALN